MFVYSPCISSQIYLTLDREWWIRKAGVGVKEIMKDKEWDNDNEWLDEDDEEEYVDTPSDLWWFPSVVGDAFHWFIAPECIWVEWPKRCLASSLAMDSLREDFFLSQIPSCCPSLVMKFIFYRLWKIKLRKNKSSRRRRMSKENMDKKRTVNRNTVGSLKWKEKREVMFRRDISEKEMCRCFDCELTLKWVCSCFPLKVGSGKHWQNKRTSRFHHKSERRGYHEW